MNIWYIIAQIFGVITITLEIVTYQIKDKKKFFLVSSTSSFFWLLMFIAIGLATGMDAQWSLVLAASYSTLRNSLFWYMQKKDDPKTKEILLRVLLVMVALSLVAGVFTVMAAPAQIRWLHASGVIASVFFAISQYLPGVHYVRIGVLITSIMIGLTQTPLNILYGDFRWNIMGVAIESAKIISVIIFYIRYILKPKEPQITLAKP
jgi:hypothetical protein